MKRNILLLMIAAALGLVPAYALARHAASMTPDLEVIAQAEAMYFSTHGSYLQVLMGQKLPERFAGTLSDYIDPSAVPSNTAINVYAGPQGQGYEVFWIIRATMREAGSINSVGYGPEAANRTFTEILPVLLVSSSTVRDITRGDRSRR